MGHAKDYADQRGQIRMVDGSLLSLVCVCADRPAVPMATYCSPDVTTHPTCLLRVGGKGAVEAPETDLFFATAIAIPEENWQKFEAFAQAPAKAIPELAELAKTKPAWQD